MRRRIASLLRVVFPVAAVLAGVVLAGCGSVSNGSTLPGAAVTTATTAIAPGTAANNAAAVTTPPAPSSLQFSADIVGGGQLDFRSYAGKTLALWFWAPT